MEAILPSSFDFSGTTPFSVEAWVKRTDPTSAGVLGRDFYAKGTGQ